MMSQELVTGAQQPHSYMDVAQFEHATCSLCLPQVDNVRLGFEVNVPPQLCNIQDAINI